MIFGKDKNIDIELKDKIIELQERIDSLEDKCAMWSNLSDLSDGFIYDISILKGYYDELKKNSEFIKNKVDVCFNRYDELKEKLCIKNEHIKILEEACRNSNKRVRNCEAKIVRLKRRIKETKERYGETEAALLKSTRQG